MVLTCCWANSFESYVVGVFGVAIFVDPLELINVALYAKGNQANAFNLGHPLTFKITVELTQLLTNQLLAILLLMKFSQGFHTISINMDAISVSVVDAYVVVVGKGHHCIH